MAETVPAGRPGARRHRGRHAVEALVALLLVALVLGPALVLPGYTLRGDMVFVPTQPWKPAWLGLDGSVPRAVPMDAVVSVLSQVLPGWLVQRALLLVPLALGAVGVARLVAHTPWPARFAAMIAVVWNPWVAERLLIGQWAIIAGYAALPWVVVAVRYARSGPGARWSAVVPALAAAAVCSPSTGVMAIGLGLGVALVAGARRTAGVVLLTGLVVNLPWVVPSLLVPGGVSVDGVSFSAFAARAESGAGLLPSLLGLGGIWKTAGLPPERTVPAVVLLAALLGLVSLAGLARAGSRGVPPRQREVARGLLVVALVCLVVAAVPGVGPVARGLDEAARHLPGLALLRDGHRFLAPMAVALAVGLAEVVAALLRRAHRVDGRGRHGAALLVGTLVAAPVLLLPSLAWGVGGALVPASYPQEWTTVASLLEDEGAGSGTGSTVVLPWTGGYRGFDWNGYRAVLDPAPRFLPGEVLVDDRTLLGDPAEPTSVVLGSESVRLEAVGRALAADRAETRSSRLRDLGVRWVLVEKGNGAGPDSWPTGTVVHEGEGLLLLDLGDPTGVAAAVSGRGWVVAGLVLAGLVLAAALLVSAIGHVTRR